MAVASDKFKLLRGNKNLTVQILIDMRDELNTSLDRAESYKNFRYLVMLGRALCREYSYRYGKKHKCEDVINQAAHIGSWVVPSCVKTAPPSAHPQCMPDEYKSTSAVRAYRNYYIGEKSHLFNWTKRNAPKIFQ